MLKLSFDVTAPVCVVVPDTVRFPVTLHYLVILLQIVPELSETSTSLFVPEKVIVPPNDVAVEFEPSVTVIELLDNLLFEDRTTPFIICFT